MTARAPAVAGLFYPGGEEPLREAVARLLDVPGAASARAVIAPHAGYVYSGSTAAIAYRALRLDDVVRIAIVGPSHRVPFDGLAVPEAPSWTTPLGTVLVDIPDAVREVRGVVADDRPHAPEHSLEVHVPFLQRLAPAARITPVVVGRSSVGQVADVVDALLSDRSTALVVSSDLSHYLPYDVARRVDRATIDQVTALDGHLDYEQACGAMPVNGLMEHARRSGRSIRELASCSSGDTAGDKDRVVGYAALVLEGSP